MPIDVINSFSDSASFTVDQLIKAGLLDPEADTVEKVVDATYEYLPQLFSSNKKVKTFALKLNCDGAVHVSQIVWET